MSLLNTFHALALAGLLLLAAPDRLAACAFHTALPKASLADDIARSQEVIAARPATDNPFRFEPVAILRGEASGQSPPYIVDSVTRARLASNPDEAVLFARAADGTWKRLLLLDAATRPLIDLMIARAEVWAAPAGAEESRDTLAGFLAHPDARLRRIALRELDALPYGVLRGGTYPVEPAELLDGIASIDQMSFAPIRILLLAFDDRGIAREAISRRVAMMAELGIGTNLGPWITAAIESSGEEGIADVERLFPTARDQLSKAQLNEIVLAFAVISAEGDPDLRSAIDGAIRRLVYLDPGAASLIVRVFDANADYSQADLIRELVAARAFKDLPGRMAAVAYISRARKSTENHDQPGHGIDLRLESRAVVGAGDCPGGAIFQGRSARNSGIGWNKGTEVFLLDDADGNTWIMKGFQLGLAPQHTYEECMSKGEAMFTQLPPGWKVRVKTLEMDLIERPENDVATIMADEHFNVYEKTGPGRTDYKP